MLQIVREQSRGFKLLHARIERRYKTYKETLLVLIMTTIAISFDHHNASAAVIIPNSGSE